MSKYATNPLKGALIFSSVFETLTRYLFIVLSIEALNTILQGNGNGMLHFKLLLNPTLR
jgi:hypothetical protein